jgi:hypothetical protein
MWDLIYGCATYYGCASLNPMWDLLWLCNLNMVAPLWIQCRTSYMVAFRATYIRRTSIVTPDTGPTPDDSLIFYNIWSHNQLPCEQDFVSYADTLEQVHGKTSKKSTLCREASQSTNQMVVPVKKCTDIRSGTDYLIELRFFLFPRQSPPAALRPPDLFCRANPN